MAARESSTVPSDTTHSPALDAPPSSSTEQPRGSRPKSQRTSVSKASKNSVKRFVARMALQSDPATTSTRQPPPPIDTSAYSATICAAAMGGTFASLSPELRNPASARSPGVRAVPLSSTPSKEASNPSSAPLSLAEPSRSLAEPSRSLKISSQHPMARVPHMQTMEREGSFSFRSTRLSGTKLEKKASSPGGEESSYGGKRAMSALERAEIGKSVKQVHQKKENFIEKMLEKVDNGVDSCMSASGLDRLCLNCACMLPVCCRPIGHKEKTPEEEAMGWRAENVIEELGEADIKEVHSAYNLFDADGDGKISLYELRELLCVIGQTPTNSEFANILEAIESSSKVSIKKTGIHDGRVSFNEFVKILHQRRKCNLHEQRDLELEFAHEMMDTNENGFIDSQELRVIMMSMGDRFTAEECDAFIKMADKGGDGQISLDDFRHMPCWQAQAVAIGA